MRFASASTSCLDDSVVLPESQSAHSRATVDTVHNSATAVGSKLRRRADALAESPTGDGFVVALRTAI